MTAFWIVGGVSLGLAAFAGLLLAIAVLVRAVAILLPPVGQFLGDVQQVREWSARRTEDHALRQQAARGTAGPEPTSSGIAPAPVFEAPAPPRPTEDRGPTSAKIPTIPIGDLDHFEALALLEEPTEERPAAPASKRAERPPGPAIEGEEGYER